jgi:pyruvate formate lyase activating enzyme
VIFHEYAIDIAQACHEVGIKTVAVTAGYIMPEPREEFFRYMDAANIDLKAFTSSFYKSLCGAELDKILETLEYVKHHTNTWLELTTLLIPGKNDSDDEIDRMTKWVVEHLGHDVPMHFSAFHPDWKMNDIPATPEVTLRKARRIAMENGVHYAYTGNISDAAGGSTYCHNCGVKVIERNQYQLGEWHLDANGHCQSCGTKIPGVFNGPPGAWGARRLPVRLSAM